jgi:phosphosulfolactate synthase (CoM biosynthesis protein A)
VQLGKRFIGPGVERMMTEAEGITENVKAWRTDVIQTITKELPREKVMFEGRGQVFKLIIFIYIMRRIESHH